MWIFSISPCSSVKVCYMGVWGYIVRNSSFKILYLTGELNRLLWCVVTFFIFLLTPVAFYFIRYYCSYIVVILVFVFPLSVYWAVRRCDIVCPPVPAPECGLGGVPTNQRERRACGFGKVPTPIPGPAALDLWEVQNQQITCRWPEASWPRITPGIGGESRSMRGPSNSTHRAICTGFDVHFNGVSWGFWSSLGYIPWGLEYSRMELELHFSRGFLLASAGCLSHY